MLKKKGRWFSKPGVASSAEVTKGIFLVVILEVGEGGGCSCMSKQVEMKVCITMSTGRKPVPGR